LFLNAPGATDERVLFITSRTPLFSLLAFVALEFELAVVLAGGELVVAIFSGLIASVSGELVGDL